MDYLYLAIGIFTLVTVRRLYEYINREELATPTAKFHKFYVVGLGIINISNYIGLMSLAYIIILELLRNVFCLIK